MIYKNFPLKKYETQVGGLLVAAVFLFASWPIFLGLVQAWRGDDYSHGFFIIPGAIYLICKKKNGGKYPPPTGTWFGLFGIFIGLIFSMVGNLCGITTLANFAFVGTIWAILLFLKGYQFLIINKWELLMLVFMIPFPSGLYAQITNPLQLIATKTSCSFMQVIGMPVFAEGNLINLPNVTLEIVNACSGLRSVITIFVLAYMLSCVANKNVWGKLSLLIVSIPIALLVNVIRVITISIFILHDMRWIIEERWHSLFGILLFIISLHMLLLSERAIECLTRIK